MRRLNDITEKEWDEASRKAMEKGDHQIDEGAIKQAEEMLKEVMEEVLEIFRYGATKHPDKDGQLNCLKPDGSTCSKRDNHASICRHIASMFAGNPIDESGFRHEINAIARLSFSWYRDKHGIVHPDDDNGPYDYDETIERNL